VTAIMLRRMPRTPKPASDSPAWDERVLREPHRASDKAARVQAMFDAIAPTYEKVNTIVSLGQDARWRRRAVAVADVTQSDVVLDVCCGTGDMIRTFAAHEPAPRLILGLDFAEQMLARGRYDGVIAPILLLRGDALRLPLRDEAVDVISCAFGVRNFQDLHGGLCEMRRVLRPGGRVVILEFASPENRLIRWGYRLYSERLLPWIGQWISRDKVGAYRYLPRSIRTFAQRREMIEALKGAGFSEVTATTMNLGTVVVYRGDV
jgi:demethylmenaquinone methyltransferase/2-methoxy-6-polyprenyl-1,4-benzoquinol methylase